MVLNKSRRCSARSNRSEPEQIRQRLRTLDLEVRVCGTPLSNTNPICILFETNNFHNGLVHSPALTITSIFSTVTSNVTAVTSTVTSDLELPERTYILKM